MNQNNLGLKFDVFGLFALVLTFISILVSIASLDFSEIIISIGIFLIIIATYVYLSFFNIINQHAKEIDAINEKINIHKDISELKAKVEFLFNNVQMKKRGQTQLIPVLIRVVQVVAILVAIYLILKALGVNF